MPEIPPAQPRAFAIGCLVLPALVLAATVALRLSGAVSADDPENVLSSTLFGLGCTFFAARTRQRVLRGADRIPRGMVTIVRYVVLGCGAIVPAVILIDATSWWPLLGAVVPLGAMVAWFPRRTA